jgi:ribosome-associated protein
MNEFSLDGRDYIALCDLLKRTGLCENGGHAKAVISEGHVKVDGAQELKKRCKIIAGNTIAFNGESIKVLE